MQDILLSLPLEDMGEVIRQFQLNGVGGIDFFSSLKISNEKEILDCATYIDICYSVLSPYNAALTTYTMKDVLWALFHKIFGSQFKITSFCKQDFVDIYNRKLSINI